MNFLLSDVHDEDIPKRLWTSSASPFKSEQKIKRNRDENS